MNYALKREEFRLKLMAQFTQGAKKILDVGLYFPNHYLRLYCAKKAEIIGLDIVETDLPHGYDNVVKADIGEMDKVFEEGTFDAILLGELIEHIEEPYKALKKCHKVLQKGGKLILTTPNPLSFPRIIFEFIGSKKYFYHKDHKYEFLPRWLIKMIETSGFEIIHKGGVAFYFSIKLPLILSDQVLIVARKKGKP